MQKIIIPLALSLSLAGWADSPLTSTEFWTSYRDLPQVRTAHDLRRLNNGLANYLLSKAPLDHKAAVINALSWNYHGQQNAQLFLDSAALKYKKSPPDTLYMLTPDEQFCWGYLMAMDDYFHVKTSLSTLRAARRRLPNSFTVAIVTELVEAQHNFADQKLWQYVEPVFENKKLRRDLRPQARQTIYKYMALYRD